ncbi:hypothetical protein B484DRAFT_222060 [Ochromonadaceae sp. CCMP2298]|nr:hypothetical protein B484DRAFT_222060 [Ochromonadaceae sp. CCMP2298]
MLRLALVLLVLADTFQSLVWSLRSLRVQQQKKSRRLSPLGAHKTEEDRLKQCQNDWNARLLANKEDKINELEADETEETEGQEARVRGIEGLMSAGDTYDPHLFSAEHKAFKAYHNLLFATVSHQCNQLGGGEGSVFYLDGPDAGTTKALLSFMNTDPAAGPAQALPFTGAQLCTANRYADTCRSIEHAAETHLSGQGGDIRVLNR